MRRSFVVLASVLLVGMSVVGSPVAAQVDPGGIDVAPIVVQKCCTADGTHQVISGQSWAVGDEIDLYINGEYVASVSGKTFDNVNPSTEQVLNKVAAAQKEDVDLAVESCHAAAKEWKKVSAVERATIMNRFADIID